MLRFTLLLLELMPLHSAGCCNGLIIIILPIKP